MRRIEPKEGDKRIIVKFLLLPKKINGESRWLEFTSFEQIRVSIWIVNDYVNVWIDSKWLDI